MAEQNFSNHARYVPMFHGVLFGLRVIAFLGALYQAYKVFISHSAEGKTVAALLVIMTFAAILQFFFSRIFPLKAQDRAIRAEENLRAFAMSGKLLDPRLTVGQIIALRFASDGEFLALANEAAAKGTAPKDIKQSIKNWRADNYRV